MQISVTGSTARTTTLGIIHRTEFKYRQPVHLNHHILMMRPRDSAWLRVKSHQVVIFPGATLVYATDAMDNLVGTATFDRQTDALTITARTEVELDAAPWPVFSIVPSATSYPFAYSDGLRADLAAFFPVRYADSEARVREWAHGFVRRAPTDTLSLLKDVSAGVSAALTYCMREAEGTQSPARSLSLGRGTCRDYAVLFAEAVRSLGMACRLVSGYLHAPYTDPKTAMSGSTHAWAQVFLPGAGWITFDPTNRRLGDDGLIPVAVGVDIARMAPITGSFSGQATSLVAMSVHVEVSLEG